MLRTIGAGVSPAEKQLIWQTMAELGAVTEQGLLQYMAFFKYVEAGWAIKAVTSPIRRNPTSHGFGLENICVGTYLCEHATEEERKNFEEIMATFKGLQAESLTDKTLTNQLVFQLGPVLKVAVQFFT